MNKLNLKSVILIGVLIVVVQQVLALLLNPLFANNIELASMLSLPLGVLISAAAAFYMLKGKSLSKADAAMQGFIGGIVAVALAYLIFVVLLSGNAQLFTLMSWVIGSTIAGYIAGK